MRRFIVVLLLASACGSATTGQSLEDAGPPDGTPSCPGSETVLHVGSLGASDDGPGTEAQPFATIQHALDVAGPHTRIVVHAGLYRESLHTVTAGAPCEPIVLEGQPGAIIDPSIEATAGWQPAPEVGPGVFKNASLPLVPFEMTIGGQRIGRIRADYMAPGGHGWEVLAYPADALADATPEGGPRVLFWDGVEALYGQSGDTTYFRERNGVDPGTLALRAAGGSASLSNPGGAALEITHDHTEVRGLVFRGATHAVVVRGAAHVVLEDNQLSNGISRISLVAGASQVRIAGNELFSNYYGWSDFAAWGGGNEPRDQVNEHVYLTFKYLFGGNTSADYGVHGSGTGSDITVSGNHLHDGLIGVSIAGDDSTGLVISGNEIHNETSIGITLAAGWRDMEVVDNLVYDCNINFRPHDLNDVAAGGRRVLIHRNRSWLPGATGKHFHLHWLDTEPPAVPLELWVYSNSLSGGPYGFYFNGNAIAGGGLPAGRFLDNIIDAGIPFYVSTAQRADAGLVDVADYNVLAGNSGAIDPASIVWLGQHTSSSASPLWPRDHLPDFVPPAGCAAIDSGLDLSQPFTIDGTTFPALPDVPGSGARGAGPDIGAVER